ncbi:MAG: acyl-CoA synthetase [Acidimicrobiia bacterium]|nr:MAG: acyl-CoA synthetase [Acidimicrobiia bacterium]
MDEPETITALLRAHDGGTGPGLRFEDETWTWAEVVDECAARAAFLLEHRPADGPFHVGVLLDNVPEFWFMLGACALSGATLVGVNPTRRGADLARDVRHTDCALLVTETAHLPLLDGAGDVVPPGAAFVVDREEWAAALAPHRGTGAAEVDVGVDPSHVFMLIFTSGTTGAPKAVRMSHGKLARWGSALADNFGLSPSDVCYSVMPLFHSNAMVAGYTNVLRSGATGVLRRRFSASNFLADVRRHGVTFFNYVGKPLTYILATPERPDDADNPLKFAFGNEAAPLDIDRFAQRFGCIVVDGYGSTEGGITMSRPPDAPPGCLGVPNQGTAKVLDPETGQECPPARFDEHGRFLNPDEAIGEIVNTEGPGAFEGYYNNEEANAERLRGGMYWTGDLGYRDEQGWFYFAGRNSEWLRVDGENFAAAPVENVLARHPDVVLAAVYAVPSVEVGDEVMAALHVRDGATVDMAGFAEFLAAQPDLSPKWVPRYVRIARELPSTATQKVLKRVLRREHWECTDEVWWRPDRDLRYRLLEPADREELRARFRERGREHLLGRG